MISPTYIIAEAGVNHNGDLASAKQMVDVAKEAGADAIKFQSFRASKLVRSSAPKAAYQKQTTDEGETQFEMLKRLELTEKGHELLFNYCLTREIEFLSTPFDIAGVKYLNNLGVDRMKLSSGDVTNGPMLVEIGMTGKPVFLSTGMSTIGEVELAIGALAYGYSGGGGIPGEKAFRRLAGQQETIETIRSKVTLLHCTTEYPSPMQDVNLRAMVTMRHAFGLNVGYSDHTEGITVAIAAVALGGSVLEKHFTLDRNQEGPDHRASVEPDELAKLVRAVRQTELALGTPVKGMTESERQNVDIVRKSLVAEGSIKKGESFGEHNLTAKRPATGLSPMRFWDFLGKPAERAYEADEVVL
jgi:N-acetylneuraminate synthase